MSPSQIRVVLQQHRHNIAFKGEKFLSPSSSPIQSSPRGSDDEDGPIESAARPAKCQQSYSDCQVLSGPPATVPRRGSSSRGPPPLTQYGLEVTFHYPDGIGWTIFRIDKRSCAKCCARFVGKVRQDMQREMCNNDINSAAQRGCLTPGTKIQWMQEILVFSRHPLC